VDEATELISDLALASIDHDQLVDLKSVCPHHGLTCKKGLCTWRARYEKKKEKECGYPKGPSNIKNYNPRPNNSTYHLSVSLVFFSYCCHEVVVEGASRMAAARMAATATGLQQMFAIPFVVHLLPLTLMRGVVGHLLHSLPIGCTNHRLRPLVKGTGLAAEDNPPGLHPRRSQADLNAGSCMFLKLKTKPGSHHKSLVRATVDAFLLFLLSCSLALPVSCELEHHCHYNYKRGVPRPQGKVVAHRRSNN
jgi:hypothetical protein